jgi:hypothetical protein
VTSSYISRGTQPGTAVGTVIFKSGQVAGAAVAGPAPARLSLQIRDLFIEMRNVGTQINGLAQEDPGTSTLSY